MRKGSKAAELFSELISDLILLHKTLKNPTWRILLDEEVLWAQKSARERRAKKQALQRLKKQGLIDIRKIGKGLRLDFTKRATHLVLIASIKSSKRFLSKGKVCVVCLDIPEQARKARHALNALLGAAEFKRVQQSVWEGRRDVVREFDMLVKQHRASSWIRAYVADDPKLRK